MAGYDGSIRINTQIDQSGVDAGLKNMQSSCNSFASTVTGIFAGISIGSFGAAALKSTGDIELATAKLETLLGSASQAQMMIDNIVKMADTTPYNSNDLIQAATTLKGFGITAEQIMPTLTALGNAAGGQAEQLKGVSVVFGQIAAQGKMMGNDVFQMINNGVPILDLLSKSMKVSRGEVKKLVEEGKIGFTEVNKAFMEFYTGSGKYAGLMAKAAQILPGMFSTMQDAAMSFGRSMVSILEPAIKDLLQSLTRAFTSMKDWLANLSPSMKEHIVTMAKVVAGITAFAVAFSAATFAVKIFAPVVGMATAMINALRVAMAAGKLTADAWGLSIGAGKLKALGLIGVIGGLIATYYELGKAMTSGAQVAGIVDGLERVRKGASALANEYKKLAMTQGDVAAKSFAQKEAGELIKLAYAINNTKNGVAAYGDISMKAGDAYERFKMIQMWFEQHGKLSEASPAAQAEVKKMIALVDQLYKKRTQEFTPETPTTGGAPVDDAKMKAQKKLYEDYAVWVLGATDFTLQAELEKYDQAYADKLKSAEGNQGLQAAIMEQGEGERADIIKKWGEKNKTASFLMGLGVAENTAVGMQEGLHYVISGVKDISYAISETFEVMGDIFAGSVDLLSWFADFSAKDLFGDFKKFIDGIANFFENELGSIPVWFDQGAKLLTDFLDGMIKNLPAIAETLGNVLEHITDFLFQNAPALIDTIFSIVTSLLEALAKKVPQLAAGLAAAFLKMLTELVKLVPTIAEALIDAFSAVLQEIIKAAPALIDAVMGAIALLLKYILANLPKIVTSLVQLTIKIVEGIVRNLPMILSALAEALPGAIVGTLRDVPKAVIAELPTMIREIIPALVALIPVIFAELPAALAGSLTQAMATLPTILAAELVKQSPAIIKSLIVAFAGIPKQLYDAFSDMAKDAIAGLVNGFKKAGDIWSKVKKVFTKFLDSIKSFFGIHSPSTVFYSFGIDIIMGMVNGLLSIGAKIWDTIKSFFVFDWSGILLSALSIGASLVTKIIDGITSTGAKIWETIKSFFVFDWTDIISEMFSAGEDLITALGKGISSMWKWLAALFDASGVADSIANVGSTIVDAITSGIKDPLNVFIDTINGVIAALNRIHVSMPKWLGGHSFSINLPYIPKLAKGTDYAQGGLTLVGENGPELVNMKSGATVFNAMETLRAMTGALTPSTASAAGNISISVNISPADMSIDGQAVGTAVFKRIDTLVRNAYGVR